MAAFLLFICTFVIYNYTGCYSVGHGHHWRGETNEISAPQHSMQCDQNDDIFDPKPSRVISTRKRRAVSSELRRLWPYGIIPYEIEHGIPDDILKTLKAAMDHWTEETCIRFTRRSTEKDFVSFHNGINCCSWVGRVGGKQRVSVGTRCSSFGVLIHELGHVIGFWHEHSRPDRDYYIKVIPENLAPGTDRNFQKLPSYKVNSFGKLYDYESVMHYGPRHFSSNWKNTIETRVAGKQNEIGQRDSLSRGDKEQANILYSCPRDDKGCSSMVKSSAGRITSPNYPDKYEANMDCVTLIQPDMSGYVLVARVMDVHIDKSANCSQDHVEIRDGTHQDSPLLTRLCGRTTTDTIVSSSGALFVRFRSDSVGSGRGFLLDFETEDQDECLTDNGGCSHDCHNTIGSRYCTCPAGMTLSQRGDYCIDPAISGSCSGILTGEKGVLASLGYPGGYMGGLSCYWMIYPPPAKEILLTFQDFDLEAVDGGSDCHYDYLEVTAGRDAAPRRYCGQALPETIRVNNTRLSLRFSSDSMLAGRGFLATYTTVSSKKQPVCQEEIAKVRGSLVYKRSSVECDTWTYIIALPSSMYLSYKYSGSLKEGSSVSMYRSQSDLITIYRRTTSIPSVAKVRSNLLKVVVNSTNMHDTFNLSWKSKDKSMCGGHLRATKTPENIYSHHTYNQTVLAPHQICRWDLSSNNRITLNFLEFDIPGEVTSSSHDDVISRRGLIGGLGSSRGRRGRPCRTNYLEIVDGGKKVGRFCNERKEETYISRSRHVKLKLVTKKYAGKGFHIKYSRLT